MAFTTKVLRDDHRHYEILLIGDATTTTGENGVIKVDRSAITGPDGINPTNDFGIEEITASVQGFEQVRLYWEHGSGDEDIVRISGESYWDFTSAPPYPTNDSSAATDGDIKLSTFSGSTEGSAVAGDTYTIKLVLRKK